jgi:hypothetical protein
MHEWSIHDKKSTREHLREILTTSLRHPLHPHHYQCKKLAKTKASQKKWRPAAIWSHWYAACLTECNEDLI